MNHYVYKIENIDTDEYYIGVRSCACEIEEDPYMGSGKEWNKRYIIANAKSLIKHILDVLDTRPLANEAEKTLIASLINDPYCVNLAVRKKIKSKLIVNEVNPLLTGENTIPEVNESKRKHSEETKAKMSKALKGRLKSEETKAKMSTNHHKKGEHTSIEVRAKMSATVKAKYEAGFRQATSKPIIVEDVQEDTIIEYPSNTDFCLVYGFDKQSVGVFIRKGIPYKKRFKIQYKVTNQ